MNLSELDYVPESVITSSLKSTSSVTANEDALFIKLTTVDGFVFECNMLPKDAREFAATITNICDNLEVK